MYPWGSGREGVGGQFLRKVSQRTLTMFVALRYQHHAMQCCVDNKHSQMLIQAC